MGVTDNDLKLFHAAEESDVGTNGGRKTYLPITPNQLLNLFPIVTHGERAAGLMSPGRYRKLFAQNINSELLTLYLARFGLEYDSHGGDYIRVGLGTYDDTQADIDESYVFIGTGILHAEVSAGGSVVQGNFGLTDLVGKLAAGHKLYVTDRVNAGYSDPAHHDEFSEIDSIEWAGSIATITLKTPLQYDYATSYQKVIGGVTKTINTRIAGLLDLGDQVASVDGYVVTSVAGNIDPEHPVIPDNKGSITDHIVLDFTGAANYTITGTYLGSLGSGSIASDKVVNNPNTSTPYMTIPASMFQGTYAEGDQVEFDLWESAQGIWMLEKVPSGVPTYANNGWGYLYHGQGA